MDFEVIKSASFGSSPHCGARFTSFYVVRRALTRSVQVQAKSGSTESRPATDVPGECPQNTKFCQTNPSFYDGRGGDAMLNEAIIVLFGHVSQSSPVKADQTDMKGEHKPRILATKERKEHTDKSLQFIFCDLCDLLRPICPWLQLAVLRHCVDRILPRTSTFSRFSPAVDLLWAPPMPVVASWREKARKSKKSAFCLFFRWNLLPLNSFQPKQEEF
jgi:hypothetical protein